MSTISKPFRRPAPRRVTQKLTGTTRQLAASLSFDAELACAYASEWLRRAGGLKVCASGVIRRALVGYALSLEASNEAQELSKLRRACSASMLSDDARQMAELRLFVVPPNEPLPPFQAVLRGHDAADKAAKLQAGADALTEAVLAERAAQRMQQPRAT
jgi:hypothetical protein